MALPSTTLSPPITEVDITALLQPRQGYLWKLGGGQETGSKCVLVFAIVFKRSSSQMFASHEQVESEMVCPPR